MPGRVSNRRRFLDSSGLRRRGSKERGFRFVTADGHRVSEAATLERIRSLRIPPAWREVRIARGARSPLQAVGVDNRGRTQYLYHPQFRKDREEEKFLRVVEFGEALPHLRSRIRMDLKGRDLGRSRVLASLVRLIDQGFFRVGNDRSARSEETFGLTTVRTEHVTLRGSEMTFDFVGKWKKAQKRKISDAPTAVVIRRLLGVEGDELFKFVQGDRVIDVKNRHVNEYIQSIIGEQFSAKDFRTWAGTLLCSMHLGLQGQASTKKERKKRIRSAIEFTADQLGNTPAVCRTSYICPRLLTEYMEGKPFHPARKAIRGHPVARRGHSLEEKALLRFLRETIADRRQREERRTRQRGAQDRRTVA